MIRDVIHRYCVEADRGHLDALFALFTEDAEYRFGDRAYSGQAGLRDLFAESARRITESGVNPGRVLHSVTTSVVDLGYAPDAAVGTTYVSVLAKGGLDHFGRYQDVFERVDGGWKIASRRFTLDWAAEAGLGELLR